MVESPKWDKSHKQLSCSRAALRDCSDCQWSLSRRYMWLVFSKSQERCRNPLKPGVRWRWGRSAVIPPVLLNKSFTIFSWVFFAALCWGCLRVVTRFERMLSFWSYRNWEYFINVRVGAGKSGTPLGGFACESSANEATREQVARQLGVVALPRWALCFSAPSRMGGGP